MPPSGEIETVTAALAEGASRPPTLVPFIVQVAKLTTSEATTFGFSVALSGDTAIVGAFFDDTADGADAGSAFIFERHRRGKDRWGQVKQLTASDAEAGDQFGASVAIAGDTAVVGAPADDTADGTDAGSGYVFERDRGGTDNWGQVKKLTASSTAEGDEFGTSVAIAGDTAVVGAPADDTADGADAGSAYVFERDRGGTDNWGQVRKLTASDAEGGDGFGDAVGLSGDAALVGAPFDDFVKVLLLPNPGSAYVFERDLGGTDSWGQLKKHTASDAAAGDRFGTSVAISADTAIVGAFLDDTPDGSNAGSAYVFGPSLRFFIGEARTTPGVTTRAIEPTEVAEVPEVAETFR